MAKKELPSIGGQSFEDLKQVNDHNAEYWSARDLQPLLGYSRRRRAVAAAYGWADYTPKMPDEKILKRLLALNLARGSDSQVKVGKKT